jgi:hypothetical protein
MLIVKATTPLKSSVPSLTYCVLSLVASVLHASVTVPSVFLRQSPLLSLQWIGLLCIFSLMTAMREYQLVMKNWTGEDEVPHFALCIVSASLFTFFSDSFTVTR